MRYYSHRLRRKSGQYPLNDTGKLPGRYHGWVRFDVGSRSTIRARFPDVAAERKYRGNVRRQTGHVHHGTLAGLFVERKHMVRMANQPHCFRDDIVRIRVKNVFSRAVFSTSWIRL